MSESKTESETQSEIKDKAKAESEVDNNQPNARQQVEVTAADLPLHCPMPGKRLWDSHPKVYLPIGQDADKGNEQTCPYCGTRYILIGAAGPSH